MSDSWQHQVEQTLSAGVMLFQRGDHGAAIQGYTTLLDALSASDLSEAERHSYEVGLYIQRGHARFIRRDLPGALQDYTQALECNTSLPDVYAYRGLIHYQSGRVMQAVADYDAAIAHYQNTSMQANAKQLAEVFFNRGNAQYQRRDYPAAEADYTQALSLDASLTDALIFRGVCRFQQEDLGGAASDYQQALHQPNTTLLQQAQIRYNQALLLRRLGNSTGALAAYTAALELNPHDTDSFMNRGSVYADLEDYESAIHDYEAALALNPWIEDGFNTCGMARMLAGDLSAAVEDFSRAIAYTPHASNIHANRGAARLQLGDYTGAIADFSVELALGAPGLKARIETREKRSEVLNNRGLAYHYTGNFPAALADYNRAIEQLRLSGTEATIAERLERIIRNRTRLLQDME